MIFLQNYKEFQTFCGYDEKNGEVEYYLKNEHPELNKQPKTGVFSEIDGKTVLFFRRNGILQLTIEKDVFSIDDDMRANWELKKNCEHNSPTAVFSLYQEEKKLKAIEYTPFLSRNIIPEDDSAFVDEEDYDFLIFIHNVLNDRKRRSSIYMEPFIL